MTTGDVPAGMPPATQGRQSSIGTADVYGSFATAVPTTIVAGTAGGARVSAASDALDREAPIKINGIGPDFLTRPAGILVVGLGALALLSYFDG